MKTCPNCRQVCFHLAADCEKCQFDFIEDKLPRLRDDRVRSPYPFFGTKKKVANDLWRLFGDVKTYIEPFLGSAAMLLARPQDRKIHCVVNDLSRYISNFWRAVQQQPDEVAKWCDWPVNETDLQARHAWLEAQPFEEAIAGTPDGNDILKRLRNLEEGLQNDPLWCDPKIAGFWAYGASCWIGDGWCTGKQVRLKPNCTTHQGVNRRYQEAESKGAKLCGRPETKFFKGVQSSRPHVGRTIGVHSQKRRGLQNYFSRLQAELSDVIVCCGDYMRVVTPCVLGDRGSCAILLDPPYKKFGSCYGRYHDDAISARVRAWAIENGKNESLRIALCEYDGAFEMPADWSVYEWNHDKGMSHTKQNVGRERVWCSPSMKKLDRLENLVRIK